MSTLPYICYQLPFTTYFTQFNILQAFVYVDDLEYAKNTETFALLMISIAGRTTFLSMINQIIVVSFFLVASRGVVVVIVW
jgi:ABC-type proline/glycine betaine transport system ATPase subunit